MKMKKQLFYILGATATVATPVVAVVSCGSTKKNTEQHKETTNTQKPQVVVDTATHNQGTEIAGLPGVVSPEDLAAKAQEAIALIDKGLAAQAAAAKVAEDNAYWNAHPSMKYVKEGAKEVLHHETMMEAIEAMDNTLAAQAESARKAELEAIALNDRVEAQTQADTQEWNSMFRVDNILETAKGYLNFIKNDANSKVTEAQLTKLIKAIKAFTNAQKKDVNVVSTFQTLAETLIDIITPTPIPQETPAYLTPEAVYSADGKLVATHAYSDMSNKAGDVVEVIKTMLLQKHSAANLIQAPSGFTFYGYTNLLQIQEDVRNILLTVFPFAEKEIKALPAEALYYAETGGSVYGIKLQVLDYLLNPANKDVAHFTDFVKARWSREDNNSKFYDVDWVGTVGLGSFNHNNRGQFADQHVAIENFMKALDAHIFTKTFGENISQEIFTSAISKFNPSVENSENIKAIEWATKANGTVFNGENGTKFIILSAEVDKADMTKAHVKFAAFGNQHTIPMMIERTISGFKKPSDHSFEIVWTHLKEMLPATIISDSTHHHTAVNDWQVVAKNIVKYLEEKYPSMKTILEKTLANLNDYSSATKNFWGINGKGGFLFMIKNISATSFAEVKGHVSDKVGSGTYFTTYNELKDASAKIANDLLDALDAASKA